MSRITHALRPRADLPTRRSAASAWLFLLLLLVGSVSAELGDRWTVAHSMKFRSISETAISPNGTLVAYVVRTPVMEGEKSEYLSHIWLASVNGESDVQFTRGSVSCTSPSFSPDGRSLAFLSARGGEGDDAKSQIWSIAVNGGEAERLTKIEAGVSTFRWSPDGTHLGFLSRDPQTEDEKERKKEKRDVILVDQNFKYGHLYTVPAAKDEEGERLTRRLTEGDFHVTSFDWSPDSQRLVYSHQPDPRINTGFSESDLSTVAAAGGDSTALVTQPGVDTAPRFSPDGSTIAFETQAGRSERVGLRDLAIVPADGGAIRPLAHSDDRAVSLIGWHGERLFFSEAARTSRRLFSIGIEDHGPKVVGSLEPGVTSAVSLDPRGENVAFVLQTDDQPPEVFVAVTTADSSTRLSSVQADVARPPMGRTEELVWQSGSFSIDGLLTYPIGYEGGRVPLILLVHGGPAGAFSHSFTGAPGIYMIQTFTQRGYAVLRPNPRGSAGYGKEFRYANVEDWGYGDYEDLMAGVDETIAMGVADADRLFLMGWSYGGYMTSFAVTRTSRFRAASMGAGLPNLVSMVHTTDIPDYLAAHMGGELWEDYSAYERHSAIHHIENVTTPIQVLHGSKDLRVPLTQGQEFYVALGRLGVETEMIVYPRTPHGPREPKLLMDVTPRILDWFARHGGPQPSDAETSPEASETQATGSE